MSQEPLSTTKEHLPQKWDVVIVGGGLAGLTLARHLLLETDRRVLLLEKRTELPQTRQKVGESSVQLAGWYFSKLLDMEEHLLHEHFMKYNLRFYWRTGDARSFEDYSASFIRSFSNIASYQLDRNVFEAELLRLNRLDDRFECRLGVSKLTVELGAGELGAEDAEHRITFESKETDNDTTKANTRINTEVHAHWVVDATGRRRLLAKKQQSQRPTSVRHGSFFWWVDGLVDVETLTDLSPAQRRKHPNRRHTGHLPSWVATNHFADEGLWFWIIPLRGKTSLGVVYDQAVVDWKDVNSAEKATRFICERFPILARDLPQRKVVDFGGFKDFSYDCSQTLSAGRWAMTGESGRFSDPLYSPGSDLIAIYNTLIVDAIQTEGSDELKRKCQTYESLNKAVFQAYLPSYAMSYDCLGDQECFALKYVWELTIYFGVYVFPFVNELLTDRRFTIGFLRQFSRLGPWNRTVQQTLTTFYRWKKEHRAELESPRFFDFTEMDTLRRAEKTFYQVGLEAPEAKRVLTRQVDELEELARFIVAHVSAQMLDEPRILSNRAFVEALDLQSGAFDLEEIRALWQRVQDRPEVQDWNLNPEVLDRFQTEKRTKEQAVKMEAVEMGSLDAQISQMAPLEEKAS